MGKERGGVECYWGISLFYGEVREWDMGDMIFGQWKYTDGFFARVKSFSFLRDLHIKDSLCVYD